jgi:uncharacterized protein (TIGR02996 family)
VNDTEQAFLRAIIALPDDDGPRLAYADYLDEVGAVGRGEFVRVQCELAKPQPLPPELRKPRKHVRRMQTRLHWEAYRKALDDWKAAVAPRRQVLARLAALRRREEDLYFGGRREWVAPIGTLLWPGLMAAPSAWAPDAGAMSAGAAPFAFRRGFVESFTARAADFLSHADALRAATPLRRVVLTTRPTWNYADHSGGSRVMLNGRNRAWSADEIGLAVGGDTVQALLAAEFPDLEFQLPPHQSAVAGGDPAARPGGRLRR